MWRQESRRYPTGPIIDADYADDQVLLVNTPAQSESLLHSMELVARGIGLYMNLDKTVFKFNPNGAIST